MLAPCSIYEQTEKTENRQLKKTGKNTYNHQPVLLLYLRNKIMQKKYMKPLQEDEIKEIVENLQCGFKCFWNVKTNALIFIPEDENSHIDWEFWEEQTVQLKKEAKDFKEIEKPASTASFEIMEDFVATMVSDALFKKELENILNSKKPFGHFKQCIENSNLRDDWFQFKNNWFRNWVQKQIKQISVER